MKKKYFLFLLLLHYTITFGQLGFCTGSKGAPVFTENFGSGSNYGPQLAAGVTNYTYVSSGFPQDGQYTLYNRTNLIPNSQNWHYSLDHTPDNEPDGTNGKCLIVNASNTPGQFYRRVVTGLCSNTTFEFSAWLMNIYNAASNACPGTGIPINVTFEIWNASDTVLLQSGSTGNINGTNTPLWTQYGLVFTMPAGQSAVILKMRNNGSGGCGNDLAIDDIAFSSCGDYSTITNTAVGGNSITICPNETITNNTLQVSTAGTSTYFYQWQESTDNITYTDITGQNAATFSIPTLATTTYYRVKIAQDITNINNNFCSTLSDIYIVVVSPLPNPPVSNGNQIACANTTTTLSVSVNANESVNWFDAATGGTLLAANSTSYTPTTIGTYYAEAINTIGCKSGTRTAVTLDPMITVSSSGNVTICSGDTSAISLSASVANATFSWTVSQTAVSGAVAGNGTTIAQTLTNNSNTPETVTYTVTPSLNGCEGTPEDITVTVNPSQTITLTFDPIPTIYCIGVLAPVLPTTSANGIVGSWTPNVIDTSISGTTTYTFTPQTTTCTNIAPYTIDITVDSGFTPNFTDISFCLGATPPVLNSISPNGITGIWNPSSINNIVSGSYTFTPDPGQCAVPQTIQTTVLEPTLTAISYTTSVAFSENQIITVLATANGNYLYQLDQGPLQENNIFQNVSSGLHTITVIDANGCSAPLSEEVLIIDYPYFFTPNGDGYNDTWNITAANTLTDAKLFIFDRYGKLLKQIATNGLGWDGTFNGQPLPATDYWFIIDFVENGTPQTFKAHFSLKR